MQIIETTVRTYVARLTRNNDPASVDMSQPLAHGLGLSSLEIVLLITNTCKNAVVPMTMLTEQDISGILTGDDLIKTLAAKKSQLGERHDMA